MLVLLHQQIGGKADILSACPISLPPGAFDPDFFLRRCQGCLTCLARCPFESISFLKDKDGKTLPFLDTENHPCHLCEDMPCASACPNGAVSKMPEHWVDMGTAHLETEKCLNSNGMICKMCYYACPIEDKALRWDDFNHLPVIDAEMCSGCGNCRALCPTEAFTILPRSAPPKPESIAAQFVV